MTTGLFTPHFDCVAKHHNEFFLGFLYVFFLREILEYYRHIRGKHL